MQRINDIHPEMLTIGALRASHITNLKRAAENNGRDTSIFKYIGTIDPSGFKYRTEEDFQIKSFRIVRDLLAPGIALGLCKEDSSVWNEAGVTWQGCHCLHGMNDVITTERILTLDDKPSPKQIKLPVLQPAI
jgi:hypothetical protein